MPTGKRVLIPHGSVVKYPGKMQAYQLIEPVYGVLEGIPNDVSEDVQVSTVQIPSEMAAVNQTQESSMHVSSKIHENLVATLDSSGASTLDLFQSVQHFDEDLEQHSVSVLSSYLVGGVIS